MSMYKIRERQPLVHCMTNYVVANFTANGLLAIGASPVMADEVREVEEMVANANALLINIGTINERTFEAMLLAGKKANDNNIPVVLDPVGVGATSYRRKAVGQLLDEVKFSAIRCNEGELATIAGADWQVKGVDSGSGQLDTEKVAKQVARTWQTIVIVTGAIDYVTDGKSVGTIQGGHENMTRITGAGCLLSAICSAAFALEGNPLIHVQHILHQYKEIALTASKADGMGAFQVKVLDGLDQYARGEGKWMLY